MKITDDIKKRITDAISGDRTNYPSDAKHAVSLGISASVYNAIKKGNFDRQISDANWVGMARRLGVVLREEIEWKVAETPTYAFITAQLELCQSSGISAIMCDMPNIGKTFTARTYVKSHKNAVYIDCSQVKTKLNLVKNIAKEFGVSTTGRSMWESTRIWWPTCACWTVLSSYWMRPATCSMKPFWSSKPYGTRPSDAVLGI